MSGLLATPEALSALAVLAGLAIGVGSWSLLAALFPGGSAAVSIRQFDPAVRIAHALRDVSAEARALLQPRTEDPVSVLGVMVSPGWARVLDRVNLLLGASDAASRLLRQAGVDYDVGEYQIRRLGWAIGGAVSGLLLVALVSWGRSQSVVVGVLGALVAVLIGAVLGAGVYDRQLRRMVQARQQRLAEEFPSILELLALALAAGESLPGALSRIAQRGSGELAKEWATVMRRVELGEPLGVVLRQSAEGIGVPEIHSMVEHLSTALERGAPLAEVVRSHSADSRNDQLRAIVDRAGKAEVWMLVPLVLLILPTTVIFAVWPSLQALQLGL